MSESSHLSVAVAYPLAPSLLHDKPFILPCTSLNTPLPLPSNEPHAPSPELHIATVASDRKRGPDAIDTMLGVNDTHHSKRQKVLRTSLNTDRSLEVKEYMHSQMLHLSRLSRDVYAAKIHYQRLRMQELEAIRRILKDELDESRGYLNRMECQIGEIHRKLHGCGDEATANTGSSCDQWSRLLDRPSPAGFVHDEESSYRGSESDLGNR
ncbi:hypothetical protein JVU11DRAFT_10889 [Chiua virens]|nr:hypothetical protein JVU11DRAFT_10889 [Chiua virens]